MTLSFLEAFVAILLIAAGWFVPVLLFVAHLDRRRMTSFHKFQGKQMTDMAQRMVAARLDPGLHSNPPPTTDAPLGSASKAQEEWYVEIVERLATLQRSFDTQLEALRTENATLRAELIAAKPEQYAEELRREEEKDHE